MQLFVAVPCRLVGLKLVTQLRQRKVNKYKVDALRCFRIQVVREEASCVESGLHEQRGLDDLATALVDVAVYQVVSLVDFCVG